MRYNISSLFLLVLFSLAGCNNIALYAQGQTRLGSIRGRLVDADTKAPLAGADITVANTILGAATDTEGNFAIEDVPVGSYTLQFTYVGYEPLSKTDVIVRSKRITFVEAELKMSTIQSGEVVVTAGYFTEKDEQPVSITTFSREEIRRAPGSAGDVSRIIMGLPSIAKVNDQSNSLIVRGGNPVENSFFIDNIEIPNINHFPTQGSSDGPLGILNVDFIEDVEFLSGGFSSVYGDRLSSIMNISFREGNRQEFNAQLDLNFAGFGGATEGPLLSENGSWLLSARRSYLDLLVNALNVGTSVAPRYGDYQGKIVYDISPAHKLTVLGVFADSHSDSDKEVADENDMVYYGNQDIQENTAGINWRALWGKKGYSNTAISYTSTKFKEDFWETVSQNPVLNNRSLEQSINFKNVNHFRLNQRNTIEFGLDAKYLLADYDNFYGETIDPLGNPVATMRVSQNAAATKLGASINYIVKPWNRLTATMGLRGDYFSYNRHGYLSPRLLLSYKLSNRTSLNGAAGIYYQNLPLVLLSQNEANKDLNEMRVVHYILGITHLLTENTQLSLEAYQKDYRHLPLDPNQPGLFILDETYYNFGFYSYHGQLNDKGEAYSRGIEIMIQKKLARNFYGMASASYFRARYKDDRGNWRDRAFDNRVTFSMEGGFKPNNKWEFSLRWIYAGGAPYTPFDVAASEAANRGILDENQINTARFPDYHSLNLRFDRRFFFSGSNLVFYFSVWNLYNHKNVASYFWNEKENRQDVIYQWGFLPIFGLEFEF